MKNLIRYTLILSLFCLALFGCGSNNNEKEESGGYSKQREISTTEMNIFQQALGDKVDQYEPLTVATQVVAGTNYKFYAKDKKASKESYVYIIIYVAIEKDAKPELVEVSPAK